MLFLVYLLTFLLVLDSLVLTLLILIQLPKKDAGIGQAFGTSTPDALFGAGSGTALTKITKYAATFFLAVTFLLAILHVNAVKSQDKSFENRVKAVKTSDNQPTPAPAATTPPAGTGAVTSATTSNVANLLSTVPTNLPAASGSNAPSGTAPK